MTSSQVPQPLGPAEAAAAKRVLRREVLAARREGGHDDGATVRLATRVLELPEVAGAVVVAAYVSVGTEPGTAPLLERLHTTGVRVLLPVLLPDGDLDWAPYEGPASLRTADRGLLEPGTERLGVDAIRAAHVVLVPGLAVSPHGHRLGRGGGSYDRALARVPDTFTCLLLHDSEVGRDVPVEAHDVPVDAAVTPERTVRFTP